MRHSSSILCRALCISMLYCLAFSATAGDTSEVNFPALDSSYLKTGDFVGPDHVKRITPGLHKDQVRLELGNPHFSEGIFNVREWDYVFNFYTGKGNEYVTCQFKVKFDSNNRATSTHWKNPECEGYVNPPQVKDTPIVPVAEKPLKRRMEFGADGLFAFGKSDLSNLDSTGRGKLDDLADHLKQDAITLSSVVVTGYTDRIGSEEANLVLSQARADTIRDYLIQKGLDAHLVRAYGAGKAKPVVQCPGQKLTPQLVGCLQPNRRMEIEIVGER
ncbi:outer membrane protein OmpA-like peptidoglycan-associated protein [Collimonas sp. PA-H2]|uniref:OmpA family protein n=1 Tax=Collimonas sp. PA-H2 TaxID=1881062 RepID=UPI000BFA05DE|nr:OmpA family protein [Collimonas sp. PA-H2]PFH10049.1 outer membrane protein OmpA-like peptidoglycan-associated protein [Collimonas sp. PA-H2]